MRFFCPYQNTLRLRVVANSDSPEDQAIKCQVRDAVLPLALCRPLALGPIQSAASRIDPSARARLGFPRMGGYRSPTLQITLGAGAGRNWWGILYPGAMGAEAPVHFESWILTLLRKWGWIA